MAEGVARQDAGRISTEFAGRPGRTGLARRVGVYEARGFGVQACISFIAFRVGNGTPQDGGLGGTVRRTGVPLSCAPGHRTIRSRVCLMMASGRNMVPRPRTVRFLIVKLLELSGLVSLQPRVQLFRPMEVLHPGCPRSEQRRHQHARLHLFQHRHDSVVITFQYSCYV